jgi:hypothetical protein
MKRFAQSFSMVLESPRLPAPGQLTSVYQSFSRMPAPGLAREYAALQQALRSLAIQTGRISKSDAEEKHSPATISKEQMVEELMLEYLKMTLGKPTPLGKQSSLFSPPTLP